LSQPQADPLASTLPAERTVLAWTRTSFAFLVNGALLTLKDLRGVPGTLALVLAGLAGAAALGTYTIAIGRQRTLQRRPIPADISPRRQVYLVGVAALLLIVMTAGAQLI
jgi:uncharacterized membrane protein YidH (DUF202 family)